MSTSNQASGSASMLTKMNRIRGNLGIAFVLILMIVALTLLSPNFLTTGNILNILRQISIISIIGIGVTFIIITTGIDLSSGSVVALASVVAASLAHPDQYSVVVPILAGILVGAAVGAFNGSVVSIGKVPAFIATLGTMMAARAFALIYSERPITGFSKAFDYLGRGYLFGIPFIIFIFAFVAIMSYILLKHTRFGKFVYAIGGNEQAAIFSGINVKKILIMVYIYAGALSGLAGVLVTSRISSGQPTSGLGYELDAIAGVVIGGTSLSGGMGTIGGTVIGCLIIGVLNNGMELLHISAYWQQVVKAIIIVGAVYMDKRRNK